MESVTTYMGDFFLRIQSFLFFFGWSEDGPHSIESVGSLQYSQQIATLTNHDADKNIPHIHTQFL
jgi:hypothetical protein